MHPKAEAVADTKTLFLSLMHRKTGVVLLAIATLLTLGSDPVVAQSSPQRTPSPKVAGIASALLPGAGQVYNQKYWKVPIIYTALGVSAFFATYHGKIYFTVNKNLNSRVRGDSIPTPSFLVIDNLFSQTVVDLNQFSFDDMLRIKETYQKYFTISLIAGGAVYLLNILDAVVDAHLFAFDISDDLSLRMQIHGLQAHHLGAPIPLLQCTFTWRAP